MCRIFHKLYGAETKDAEFYRHGKDSNRNTRKYCSLWRMFLKYNKNGIYSFSNATTYSRQTQSFNKLSAHDCNYCKTRAEKIKLYDIAFVCRLLIALSTASTITPTSANTAIPIVANPKKASSKTATLIRMANQAFCKAI